LTFFIIKGINKLDGTFERKEVTAMRRILFFLFLLLPAALVAAEEPREIDIADLALSKRLSLRLPSEIDDELYPRPWHPAQGLRSSEAWNPHLFETEDWKDIEDDAFDDLADAARHVGTIEIKESDWFQNLEERAESWFDRKFKRLKLRFKAYFRRPKGKGTQKEITLDVGFDGEETEEESRYGISFSHLDDPSPFFRFGHKPHQELMWHPRREKVEWYFREMPRNLDFRLQ